MSAERLFLLLSGAVRLSFRRSGAARNNRGDLEGQVPIHTLTEPGRPVGWSALVAPYRYRASAVASAPTRMLVLEREFLSRYCLEHPDAGVVLMRQVLGVLGNRLRASRIRLVAQRFEHETLAIRALLDQSAELLGVDSALHKLPHYLENRLTLADAFDVLEAMRVHGDQHERPLAGLCLEILQGVRREMRLYQDLQRIYQHVATAPPSRPPEEVRRRCSLEFISLFSRIDYTLRGEEHLPDRPGHIFILNHLANHPENTLPNAFQLTLDTHFVSAMILFRRYGQAPIRVIRKSRPDEYGHQRYYDRLGYLYVYRGHVDDPEAGMPASAAARRKQFLEAASAVLRKGTNVVICPEGTSTSTERSPLPFRPGAFRLAAYARPEPLIVPIAVANFDKKITRSRVAALVHPPFRLSEVVADPRSDPQLYEFLHAYHREYREYVREAIAAARS